MKVLKIAIYLSITILVSCSINAQDNLFDLDLPKVTRALCASPTLTEVVGSPFTTDIAPRGVAYSPNNNFLAVANATSNSIGIYSVNSTTGALSLISNFTDVNIANPFGIVFAPNGNYLAIADQLLKSVIASFSVSPSGSLSPAGFSGNTGVFATNLAFSANGNFVALVNSGDGSGTSFTFDSNTGMFGPAIDFNAQTFPFDIKFHPNNLFAAVVNRDSNTVTVYLVNQITGAFTPNNGTVAASSFATQLAPQGISFSPDGKFAAITNRDSNSVTVYSVNQITGDFTPITGSLVTSSFPTGTSPLGVAYAPDYTMLVVANNDPSSITNSTISVYTVDSTTGTLTPLSTLATQVNPFTVAFSPNSNFVSVTNNGSNTVSVFKTNTAPQANPISGTTTCNQQITMSADFCGVQAQISAVSTPAHGTASFSGDLITYTPNTNFSGIEVFTYTVTDNVGRTASATVTVDVLPIAAPNISVTTPANTPVIINITPSCGTEFTITSITQPSHGSAVINGQTIIYTPASGFIGVDMFTYSISDSSTGTITVTVLGAPNPSALVQAIIQKYCSLRV